MSFYDRISQPCQRLLAIVPAYFLMRALLLLLLGLCCVALLFAHLQTQAVSTATLLAFILFVVTLLLANAYLILWYPLQEAGNAPNHSRHPVLFMLAGLSLTLALLVLYSGSQQGADARILAFGLLLPACSAAGLRWTWAIALLSLAALATLSLLTPHTGWLFALLVLASQFVTLILFKSMIEEFQNRRLLDLNLAELQAAQALLHQNAVHATRHAIARDLHDELGHQVTRLHHCLQGLQRQDGNWQQAGELLATLHRQIRAIALQLRQSPVFELQDTLALLGQSIARPSITWTLDNLPSQCAVPQGEALFRLCQEAITNCLRHSNASHMHIRIHRTSAGFHVRAEDNGNCQGPITPGNGLSGLRERVETLGGELTFAAHEGGFVLEARLPESHHDAHRTAD